MSLAFYYTNPYVQTSHDPMSDWAIGIGIGIFIALWIGGRIYTSIQKAGCAGFAFRCVLFLSAAAAILMMIAAGAFICLYPWVGLLTLLWKVVAFIGLWLAFGFLKSTLKLWAFLDGQL